ncbi:MAG: DUF4097 family beta strand repeat protein [Acidobacteria bacterium]|nr:DUF4097 family beta strand repeat protein [Acidobacteriota bacterium]
MSNGTAYRRGSVFGAFLLIGVGALFLYANQRPDVSPWPLLARYWPVVIIFWGLGKLVDYFMLRGTPEGVAATRVTGGDIFSLVILLLFGTFLTRAVESGWWSGRGIQIGDAELACLLGQEYEFTDQITQDVSPQARLEFNNLRGNITVTGSPGRQVRLVARKRVCAGSDAEAHRLAKGYALAWEGREGTSYTLYWKAEVGESQAVRADLDVEVPKDVSLRVSSQRGDVRATDLQGSVELDLNKGAAHVEKVQGTVVVRLERGSAELIDIRGSARVEGRGDEVSFRNVDGPVTLQGEFYGPIHFARTGPVRFESRRTSLSVPRVEGEVTLDSGRLNLRGARGDISLSTRGKDIEMEDIQGRLEIESRDGPVLLRFRTPPVHDIQVENRSADIELFLPENSGFEIHASARDGEIESDFSGGGLSLQGEDRDTQTLTGTYGARRALIQLSTTYGTIHLRRTPPGLPAPRAPAAPPSAPSRSLSSREPAAH